MKERSSNKKKLRVGYVLSRGSKADISWQIRMLEGDECTVTYKDVSLFMTDSRPGLYLLLTELPMNSEVCITSYTIFGEVFTFKSFLEALREKECTLYCSQRENNFLMTYLYPTLNPDGLRTFINVFDSLDRFRMG